MMLALTNLTAPGSSSPLTVAAAASVALHVALLAGLPELRTHSPTPAQAPLNARIEPGPPAGAVPAPVLEEPARTAPLAEAARRPPPRTPAPRRTAAPSPALPRAVPAPAEAPPVHDPAETPPAPPAERAAVAAAASSPGSGAPSGEPTLAPRAGDNAPDAGSLAQYRLALIGAAKRYRLYPAQAVDRGWHGRVDVRLVVGADGTLARAEVRASSGHAVLDGQAVEMLRRAKDLTPLPPALRDRGFTVDVPVVFELHGAG